MSTEVVASVLANVLYIVVNERVSVRRAFTRACKALKCSSRYFTREDLYNAARDFVSSYYKLKYIAETCGRREQSYRLLARLYLYLRGADLGFPLSSKLKKSIKRDFPNLERALNSPMEPWAKLSYPKWFYEELATLLPEPEVERALSAMNTRTQWIRVNTLKVDLDKALKNLEEEGVNFAPDPDVPFLLRFLGAKKPLRALRAFREGLIIVQDKASVLVVKALKPEPGSLVYDYAAAPGIKASLIMQLTENKARVVAVDFSLRRLEVMKNLLKLYGVDTSRVVLVQADSRAVELRREADIALLDAPCTSSGAISKDPAIKVFLSDKSVVYSMKALQVDLLYNALRQVDAVVYATCSMLPEEGEEVVEEVLRRGVEHKLVDAGIRAQRGYSKFTVGHLVHRTMPHLDNCEGFFIARFEK